MRQGENLSPLLYSLFFYEFEYLRSLCVQYTPFTLNTVLHGSEHCTFIENAQIVYAVQEYIMTTYRFSTEGIG